MRPLESKVLAGNPLGDPSLREVPVYLPPQANERRLPVVWLLSAFTGTPQGLFESHPWKRGALWEWDRTMASGAASPAIVCMPNTFTRLGGSQFVNSSAVGRYQDYVLDELIPFVESHYPVLEGARGVVGKSSGGFGALHLCMQRPGTFQAAASIAGDCHFEASLGNDLLCGLREIQRLGGDPKTFLEAFFVKPNLEGDGHAALNLLAMAACYSPNPESPLGWDLPVDLHTGERIEAVWARWKAFDPIVACRQHSTGLRALRLLYLEAGTRDEFHLQFGLRIFSRTLTELGIAHQVHEFEGGHFGMDRRYSEVLPLLTQALAAI